MNTLSAGPQARPVSAFFGVLSRVCVSGLCTEFPEVEVRSLCFRVCLARGGCLPCTDTPGLRGHPRPVQEPPPSRNAEGRPLQILCLSVAGFSAGPHG